MDEVSDLLGNGKARVERTRSVKHGVDYGKFQIMGSCTVSITCNQDDATIERAIIRAGSIADRHMKQDEQKMLAIIKASGYDQD